MFEDSLLHTRQAAPQRRQTRAAIAASLSVQALVCTFLLVTPMLWPQRLPVVNAAPRMMRLTPEPPKPRPQPVQPKVVREMTAAISAPSPQPVQEIIRRGGSIVRTDPTIEPLGPGLPGSFMAMTGPGPGVGAPFGSPTGSSTGTPVVLAKPSGKPAMPRVSGGVTQGLLLAPIVPVYPQIAKATRTQGTVVITATIDKSGRIIGAQASSGPAILRQAALDAVAAARYRPYLLNGEPTEIVTTITVNFILGS